MNKQIFPAKIYHKSINLVTKKQTSMPGNVHNSDLLFKSRTHSMNSIQKYDVNGSMMMAAIYDEYSDLEERTRRRRRRSRRNKQINLTVNLFMKENSTMIHLIIFRSMVSGKIINEDGLSERKRARVNQEGIINPLKQSYDPKD